jgi:ATP-binding cassette, subfamily B, bacterial
MKVWKFLLQVTKPYRFWVWSFLIFSTLIAFINAFEPYIVKLIIDTSIDASHNPHVKEHLFQLFLIFVVLQVSLNVFWFGVDYVILRYNPLMRMDIANFFLQKLDKYQLSFFQNQFGGSITSKISDVFNYLPMIIVTLIANIYRFLILLIISIMLLYSVDKTFAISIMVWVLFFGVWLYSFLGKNLELTEIYHEKRAGLVGLIADFISNISSVKLFANFRHEVKTFNSHHDEFVNKARASLFYSAKHYYFSGLLTSIYIITVLWLLISGYHENYVNPGDFAFVVMINFTIIDSLFNLTNMMKDFVHNWSAIAQALKIIDDLPQIQDMPNAKELIITQGKVEFKNVKFHYKCDDSLFENKSITIAPGQKVGLVGYSGSGKSTFVNIILRLYDIHGGSIKIDGYDTRECSQESLRRNIATIPQDPSLFHRTLMENIRYGRIDASDEEVIEAAKAAHAHEFIETLEDKYNSYVGERGVKLSGGQRQRIAIARAFLKNAPILILDEATSQLDSMSERLIQESLWDLMNTPVNKGSDSSLRTTIVIAHRLSTLLNMDRILVFEKGRIIEDGSHHDLLNKKEGVYKKLWDSQVGGFLIENRVNASKKLVRF